MNYITTETLTKGEFKIENCLPEIGIANVKDEIVAGLTCKNKYISSKFFYDAKGSDLFETITTLQEYYPTRTEKAIISSVNQQLQLDFTNLEIVELGSGDHSKIRLLLQQIPQHLRETVEYFPVDISQSAIEGAAEKLEVEFPELSIHGIVADFIHQLDMLPPSNKKRLFCFFGSTIGNLTADEAKTFIQNLSEEMNPEDALLLGMDMVKDTEVLHNAYNDAKGVTAEFNLNILNVVNRLADANFSTADFEHKAFFNPEHNRIEMHLIANKDVIVSLGDQEIQIKKGENIHTENSHKYTPQSIQRTAEWGGLKVDRILTDKNRWFSLVYFRK